VGGWVPATQNPKVLSEAQGAVISDHFWVIFGGFDSTYDQATADTYALDLDDPNAEWQKQDDYPLAPGITHAANVVVGSKLYVCGGYLGGHPGPHVEQCFVFDFSIAAGTGQWSQLPALPAGRGGGGLTFDSTLNTLMYAGGAERPNADFRGIPILDFFTRVYTVDYLHAWTLNLNNLAAGWEPHRFCNSLGRGNEGAPLLSWWTTRGRRIPFEPRQQLRVGCGRAKLD